MIILDKVSKKFDQSQVIKEISLKIKEGEIVGLLGPNGAGKTTTVRMIAGVLPPSSGKVSINNQDLFDDQKPAAVNIGYLPENNPLYDDVTVEEYLNYWLEIKKVPVDQKKIRLEKVIKAVGLISVFYRPIAQLSKGYRQRAGLAQAILSDPQILLLDEPTEGLDPNQRKEIHELIMGLGKKRTVIICSHVLSEIAKMCNRIIIINAGKIVTDSPANKIGLLGEGRKYQIMAKGKEIKKHLEKVDGFIKVEVEKASPADRYHLYSKSKKDLRLALFELAKKQKWQLYELVAQQEDLEDLFAKVTKE